MTPEESIADTDKRLTVHEAICAQRYEAIQKRFDDGSRRMSKIENLLYIVIATILLGPGVAAEIIKKLFHI